MDAHLFDSVCRSMLLAAGIALAFPLPGIGADKRAPLTVQIFPVHYTAAGRTFDDLAALERWLRSMPIRTVSLQLCGRQPLTRLLAAVERFQPAYPEGIRVSALAPADADCASSAAAQHADIDYFASDKHGRSILP